MLTICPNGTKLYGIRECLEPTLWNEITHIEMGDIISGLGSLLVLIIWIVFIKQYYKKNSVVTLRKKILTVIGMLFLSFVILFLATFIGQIFDVDLM